MDRVSTLLPRSLKKLGIRSVAESCHVLHITALWIAETFPDFKDKLTPLTLKHGILTISSNHSALSQECAHSLESLRAYIATHIPHAPPIEDIRIIRSN